MRFSHQVVVITGAARGIGFATAQLFAAEGARVVLADRSDDCAAAGETLLAQGYSNVLAVRCDVAVRKDVEALFHKIASVFGEVDILVNNAGITRDALFHKLTEEQWDSVMDVNLKSMLFTTQAALGHMLKKGKGAIVNLASVSGQMGNVGQSNYASSKAGVEALTRTLCLEYAAKGIRINAVAPGFTYSEMTKAIPETVVEAMLKKIPMRRGAEPQEIARAILFLASEDASFINGQTLSVNGGMFFS